jgi:gliding motility-associated-like protein
MDRKDTIEELFKQKLADHQVSVNPELWSSIASKIPAVTSAAIDGGMTLVAKAIIGVAVAASVVGLGYLISVQNATTEKNTIKIQEKTTIKYQPEKINTNSSNDQSSVPINNEAVKKESISIVTNPSALTGSLISETLLGAEIIQSEVQNLIPPNTEKGNSSNIPYVNEELAAEKTENNASNTLIAPITSGKSNAIIQDLKPTEGSSLTLVLPNIFTPNGDGNNDVLTLDASTISDFSIVVLNSAGIVVYQSNDSAFSWNGTLPTGNPVDEGNFIYYITGKDSEGKLVSKHSRLVVKH